MEPVLVMIDLQKDFYHPEGSYGRAGRPLGPIRRLVRYLSGVVTRFPRVIRIRSVYASGQFPDMPALCSNPGDGGRWHPDLEVGPLLTKQHHSGFDVLNGILERNCPVVLAGVCTHRCIRATLEDFLACKWPVKILKGGVASCGLRASQHRECINRWSDQGLLYATSEKNTLPNTGRVKSAI